MARLREKAGTDGSFKVKSRSLIFGERYRDGARNFEVVGGTCLLLYTRYILIMSLRRQNTIIGIRIFARK